MNPCGTWQAFSWSISLEAVEKIRWGVAFCSICGWYGLGRAWIEGLRTDSLYFFGLELFGMPIRVSQMVAAVCFLAAGALLLYQRFRPHDPAQLYVNRLRIQAATQETEKQETKKEE